MNPTWLYVGALYALAAWLGKLPRRVALLFYLLVLLFLFRPMTGDWVNIASDVPQLIAPWSAPAPGFTKYDVSNFETQDVPMQLVPWMHQVRSAWRAGRLPLWNELSACGYTLLGNGQAQALSPLRLLALPLPLKYAIAAEGAMKILVALSFTFLYCRRRYGIVASIVAAIAFGFGPFVVVWLHFAIATTAVYLPMVMVAIDLLGEARTPKRFALMAVAGALVVSGGHPETGLHIAAFAAVYALVMYPRALGRFAAAALVAALLAAPLLMAMGEAIPQSFRYEQVKEWSREVPFSDKPSLSLLVQPRRYGRQNPAGAESVTGFAGILGFAGLVASCLLPVAGRFFGNRQPATGNRTELFFAASAVFVFLVLANWHPATRVADVLFGLAANMRLRFLFVFCLAVLTASFIEHARGAARYAGLGLAALLLLWVDVNPTIIASLAVLAVAALPWRILLIPAVLGEIWIVTIGWNPTRPASTFYPRTPLIDAIPRGQGHVIGLGGVLFPNTNALFGIEDVRFHDPMVPARYVHAMGLDDRDYYVKWAKVDDALDTRWVLTDPGREAPYVLRYDGPDGRLYENLKAKPRFWSDTAMVTVTTASPTRYSLTIDAPRPAHIMSSVGWARGWTPSKKGVFVSFDVPAGRHVVNVHYAPLHIYAAFAVSLATMLALAAYIIRARV